ncbi:MAG: hypothetical protein DRP11_02990 [Candidatus Aenigmatarchaeota archaeon]|nr:MAG: hypothetical protein DRP11_02990 [Candidatus Aenigmarchaeota archaeon]
MIRVFDNIIDGHITGNELDRTVSKEILDQLVEFLEFGIEKENIKRDLPHLTGLIGSFEIANEFRDNLYEKLPQDSIEEFFDDLKNLCAVWANDKEFHHLDGETSTERVGTYMLCSVMDLAGFEDFVRNPEIKEIAAVGGKMVQIMDDLMDGDKGADSEELKDMFEKNKNRLKRIMEGVDPTEKLYKPSKEFLHSLQIYPYLSKISDSELYRNIRNSVSILI